MNNSSSKRPEFLSENLSAGPTYELEASATPKTTEAIAPCCLWGLGDKTLLLKIFCGLAKGYRESNLSLQLPWTLTCQLAFTVLEGAVGAAGRENASVFSPSTVMQHRLPRQVVSTGGRMASEEASDCWFDLRLIYKSSHAHTANLVKGHERRHHRPYDRVVLLDGLVVEMYAKYLCYSQALVREVLFGSGWQLMQKFTVGQSAENK